MKKLRMALILILVASSLFAAPTDDEVQTSLEGVFAVYGSMFMASLMQAVPPGVSMDLNMENGSSSLIMDNLDVESLMTSIGQSLEGTDGVPPINFTRISGSFTTSAEGDMEMDVILTGGPVKKIKMTVDSEELVELTADGKSYLHMADEFDYES